jgi:hypothetical protein
MGKTVGEVMGLPPAYRMQPQYKSKLTGEWANCREKELPLYEKFAYETRTIKVRYGTISPSQLFLGGF